MPFSPSLRPGTSLPAAGRARFAALAVLLAGSGAGTIPCRAQAPAASPVSPAPLHSSATSKNAGWVYGGTADVRWRDSSDRETRGSYITATRLQGDWIGVVGRTGAARVGARIQLFLETEGQRNTAINHLRASEVYAFYNFSLQGGAAQLKAGQFVLPFGLAAVYDPLQPVQPLYEKSVGLRVDTGMGLEGEYGPYRYTAALTTGSGPDRSDFDANRLVSFSLSRTVTTPVGVFEVGGSLLSGRGPVTSFDTQLPASGYSGAREFIDKTRIGGDGQYFFGLVALRGEIVFGGDNEEPVWGYFAEGNYRATPRLTLVALRKLWNFPQKPMSSATTGAGVNYDFGNGFTLRALYEFERQVPLPPVTPIAVKRLTLQTRINF